MMSANVRTLLAISSLPENLPRLRNRRTNHLRPKLLKTLQKSPLQTISPFAGVLEEEKQQNEEFLGFPSPPIESYEDGDSENLRTGDVNGVGNGILKFEGQETLTAAKSLRIPKAFYVGFVLLFLGGCWICRKSFGRSSFHDVGEEKEWNVVEEGKGDEELRRIVSKIQVMAKEARAVEGRKVIENGGGDEKSGEIVDEVKRRVGRSRKRIPRLNGRTEMGIAGNEPPESTKLGVGKSNLEAKKTEESVSNNAKLSAGSHSLTKDSSLSMSEDLSSISKTTSGKGTQQKYPMKLTKSAPDDHLWWLKLSHVMAIFLHRGSDRKQFRGLYSFKHQLKSDEGGNTSYTVVFQDRTDATNFSYLLETFFEDLDDFSADVLPLATKELYDAVKSEGLQVVVVRKGQLRLYAGQPLVEAEMQLSSILR